MLENYSENIKQEKETLDLIEDLSESDIANIAGGFGVVAPNLCSRGYKYGPLQMINGNEYHECVPVKGIINLRAKENTMQSNVLNTITPSTTPNLSWV